MEIDIGHQDFASSYIDYVNVPPLIGMVISCGKATLAELNTVLGLEDLHDLVEIIRVDAHNAHIAQKASGADD